MPVDWFARFEADGFTLLPAALAEPQVEAARAECAAALTASAADDAVLAAGGGPSYGARNLRRLWPEVVGLLRAPGLAEPLRRILGPNAGLVRTLYFDKPPGCSWALPMHRDLTIAVRQHLPGTAFRKPTVKAGVPHVEASRELLATMATARVHLDAMTAENGPLAVIPGSHRCLDGPPADSTTLHCRPGDVLLMRPLLLHASSHSHPDCRTHRRIVHFEFAPSPELPDGLEWHEFLPLGEFR